MRRYDDYAARQGLLDKSCALLEEATLSALLGPPPIPAGKTSRLVAYQPIVSLTDRRILGAAALLRWDDPVRGSISPVEFIPIAESTGLIVPIGAWVMNRACQDIAHLYRATALYTSVHLSARQQVAGACPALPMCGFAAPFGFTAIGAFESDSGLHSLISAVS